MYHQPLELEDFLVVNVDFGCGRYIESLAVITPDDAQFIDSPERAAGEYAVAKGKETLCRIPAQFPDTLCRIGL